MNAQLNILQDPAPAMTAVVNPLNPLGLNKKEAARFIGCGSKIIARMIHATRNAVEDKDKWLKFSCNHEGRPRMEVRVTTESARSAFGRLCKGEEPPLLPCELLARTKEESLSLVA
jgi:hypothetical protein